MIERRKFYEGEYERYNKSELFNRKNKTGRTRQEEITTTTMGNLGGEENMRDYRIKDTLILACDHGYGNIKSCHSVFKSLSTKVCKFFISPCF